MDFPHLLNLLQYVDPCFYIGVLQGPNFTIALDHTARFPPPSRHLVNGTASTISVA